MPSETGGKRERAHKKSGVAITSPHHLYNADYLLGRTSTQITDIRNKLREPLATNGQRVKRITTIGSALESVFFSLCELLSALILAAIVYTGSLYRDNKVLVVLAVDTQMSIGFALEHTVNEQLLLHVVHRFTNIDIAHLPPLSTESLNDYPSEVLIIHSIVATKSRAVIIEYNLLVLMIAVILTEVANEFHKLALILNKEGFNDTQIPAINNLSGNKPIDYLLHDNFFHDRVQPSLRLYGIAVEIFEQNFVHAYGWANSL